MTDITTKPLYVRCNGCQERVHNSKLDIDAHKLNCPYDIKLALQKALERITELEQTVERVDQDVEELTTSEPAIDIDSVGDWPDDDDDTVSTETVDEASATAPAVSSLYSADLDDDYPPTIP